MIAAIVLAAGEAARFGQCKQLVPLDGKPLLEHVLDSLRASRVEDIVVVLGAHAGAIREQVRFGRERVVENPDYASGMSTSIGTGLRALSPEAQAAMIVLGDQPFVSPRTLDALLEAARRSASNVIIPTFHGRRGNPVIVPRALFEEMMTIRGDVGGRAIFGRHPEAILEVPVDDRGVVDDVDTPADLANPLNLIERLRRAGRRATMATLVRTIGTTPRKEGTKMFVDAGGEVFGSVTIGGCVDARVMEETEGVLASSAPRLVRFDLGDAEAWEIGLTCGGTVDVLMEPLTEEIADVYAIARRELEAGRAVALVTRIATGERSIVLANGSVRGSVPESIRSEALSSGSRTIAHDGADLYIEVLRPPLTLVIFGAGVVAIPLISFAKVLGFRTVVVDGRPRFATRERFPNADELRVGISSEIAEEMPLGPTTPVVLVAHDYKIDILVLVRALNTDAPYIGLLGSRRRGAAILQMLREEGLTEEQLRRVRVPVGLDLGGSTAEEIALAVMAEIVAVLHGRGGGPLSS